MHWHANPQYRFASRPDLMNDYQWRRGFALLEKLGLVFELQVFTSQMAKGAKLAADFSGGLLDAREEAAYDGTPKDERRSRDSG